jgi:hypothetical protein
MPCCYPSRRRARARLLRMTVVCVAQCGCKAYPAISSPELAYTTPPSIAMALPTT